jgi:RNA polymerase sigma-70 factor (ECF subfamily)
MIIRTGGGGRDAWFETLYRRYYGRVYRFFRKFVGDDQAQDFAQETFHRIYKTFGEYRGEAEWAFIEQTARRVLSNWLRAQKTGKRNAKIEAIDGPDFTVDPPAPEEPDLAERQEAQLRSARLWAAIAELPEGQRQCIEHWLGDVKYEGIAKILGITVDAVKSRLLDAKKTLRARLGESLPEDDDDHEV